MMTWEISIGLAGLALTLLAMLATAASFVVSAVWAVAKVQSTTDSLRLSIDHLTEAFDGLKTWMRELATVQGSHGERLVRLETRIDVCDEEE